MTRNPGVARRWSLVPDLVASAEPVGYPRCSVESNMHSIPWHSSPGRCCACSASERYAVIQAATLQYTFLGRCVSMITATMLVERNRMTTMEWSASVCFTSEFDFQIEPMLRAFACGTLFAVHHHPAAFFSWDAHCGNERASKIVTIFCCLCRCCPRFCSLPLILPSS
jgi:hypothetical protein